MNSPLTEVLPEKEFSLIQELVKHPEKTQRELSESVGFSLGMTNLLLKRLARKGYIKAKQLTWNKTQYLLTFKGAMEKSRKSCAYAMHTWQQARKITLAIQDAVLAEYQQGARRAVVVAWPETEALIRGALAEKELSDLEIEFAVGFKYVKPDAKLVFTATIEPSPVPAPGRRFVPLLDKVDLEFRFE